MIESFNIQNLKTYSSEPVYSPAPPTVTVAMSTLTAVTTSPTPTPTGDRAPSQGGIFEGMNPSVYNPADPIIMFIIQATIVITLTRLLYWPLSKIREPRVIAEVIAVSLVALRLAVTS